VTKDERDETGEAPREGVAPDDAARRQRAFRLMDQALDVLPSERGVFLENACAGDDALRAEVESLLAADDALARDGKGEDEHLLRDCVDAVAASVLESDTPAPAIQASAWMGRGVGGYRILRLLGEGGMGLVFEAEQESPRRFVALKVVRGGLFVDEARLRLFQREMDALARLQHPGIAAIYEAGRTDDGQQYFAMELVRGRALDEHVREVRDPRARLSLFLEIADAIAYAHRRGVIHRDLKPSNVAVGEDGRARVLDFGLARITDGDVALSTVASAPGAIQGTLPYMSPEQARGDPAAIDLRSDVYSLGVMLFEMLSGTLPIDVSGMQLPGALHAIAETSPKRAGSLDPSLRGDLETILGKALEKDPSRRYASVDAFAEDVRRYLDDQPILARPPSTVAQIRRLARRHRAAAIAGAAALATLVAGIVVTTTAMLRAREAERLAREEAATAESVSSFLVDLFLVSDPGESRGNSITAREILDRGVAEVDTALATEPFVRGRLLGTMGQVYRNLGLYAQARPLLERSVQVRAANPREDPAALARSHFSLAGLLRRLGDLDAAQEHYEAALVLREKALDADDPELAASLQGIANLKYDRGDAAGALPLYDRSLAIAKAKLGVEHSDYPSFLAGRTFALYGMGRLDEAIEGFREVVRLREKAAGADHPTLGYDLLNLAMALREAGRPEEALPVAERAVAVSEKALGPDHANVGEAISSVGSLHALLGRHADAEKAHRRALSIFERALAPDHVLAGRELDRLADILASQGRTREALALWERAEAILAKRLTPDHASWAHHREIRERLRAAEARSAGR